jgi:hypothetical protein
MNFDRRLSKLETVTIWELPPEPLPDPFTVDELLKGLQETADPILIGGYDTAQLRLLLGIASSSWAEPEHPEYPRQREAGRRLMEWLVGHVTNDAQHQAVLRFYSRANKAPQRVPDHDDLEAYVTQDDSADARLVRDRTWAASARAGHPPIVAAQYANAIRTAIFDDHGLSGAAVRRELDVMDRIAPDKLRTWPWTEIPEDELAAWLTGD